MQTFERVKGFCTGGLFYKVHFGPEHSEENSRGRVLPGRDVWAGDCLMCFANCVFLHRTRKKNTLETLRSGLKISAHLPIIHIALLTLP